MSSKDEHYTIYLYTSPSGKEVVKNFIHRLNNKTKARIRNAFRLLGKYGLQLLTTSWVKKIYSNPSIYELRITGKIQVRLLFFQYDANTFVVTNVFIKKQPKTPKKELITSIKRAKEFL